MEVHLKVVIEDRDRPDFYSHTISPEADTATVRGKTPLMSNKSKGSLQSVLLKDEKDIIAFQIVFDLETDDEAGGESAVEKFVGVVNSINERGAKKKEEE